MAASSSPGERRRPGRLRGLDVARLLLLQVLALVLVGRCALQSRFGPEREAERVRALEAADVLGIAFGFAFVALVLLSLRVPRIFAASLVALSGATLLLLFSGHAAGWGALAGLPFALLLRRWLGVPSPPVERTPASEQGDAQERE